MAQVVWTTNASSSFNKIVDFIALDNLSAATALRTRIIDASKRLAEFPYSGSKIPELQTKEHREIIVGPCRVFYRIKNKEVRILFVIRAERKFRIYLLKDYEKKKRRLHDRAKGFG